MSDNRAKKLLWHSGAPWAPTGYGQQTALFTPRIRDHGYSVAISSTWGLMGSALEWDGMPVFPSDDRYGNATLRKLYGKLDADLLITLMDVWVLNAKMLQGINVGCWVPVDHDPCPPRVADFFKQSAARPIAMSRFGETALKNEGLDPLYAPHGVDTNVFMPASNRAELREAIGLPKDAFVVGMVANNQGHTPSRKAFPQAIQAFAAFRAEHPDAMLYLHTEMTGQRGNQQYQGVNLPALLERFEVPPSAVGFADQLELDLGIPASWMVALYNSMDVLLMPSYGEGFGVPLIEAQACGTPVIATDWTAMTELVGAGWLVGGEPWWDVQHGAFYLAPFVGDIVKALESAYVERGNQDLRDQARAFAEQYGADRVMAECWVPVLEALGSPREVPPLRPPLNREMRRRAARAKAA